MKIKRLIPLLAAGLLIVAGLWLVWELLCKIDNSTLEEKPITNFWHFEISKKIDLGDFGDIFGGTVGTIFALAGVILFYAALTDQKEAIKIQSEELISTRKEMALSREIYELQRFENTFFNLLQNHYHITVNLVIKNPKETKAEASGRECFTYIWKELHEGTDKEKDIAILLETYERKYRQRYENGFNHYFNNVLKIMLYCDAENQKIADKHLYISFLIDQLSVAEQKILLLHHLCNFFENNAELLFKRYDFFKILKKSKDNWMVPENF